MRIAGSSFAGATQVLFGMTPATSFTIDGAEQITAIAPAGPTGLADVRVVGPGGTSAVVDVDRFAFTPPVATSATPARELVCARVPSLKRHTLKGARKMLAHDGCRVTLVHKGHAKRGPSHVKSQFPKPGTPRLAGQRVTVRLG